jgi:hypothetical protein
MRTTGAMSRMVKDAYQAVGDETNRGVIAGSSGTQSICFRRDADNNPSTYAGDQWTCYYASPANELWLCGAGATPPVNNLTNCSQGAGETALLDLSSRNIASVVDPQGTGQFTYVEITISSVFDRTQAYHPITNPRYTLTSRVSPPGHSG